MKIELWGVGKTQFPYLKTGIDIYIKRLQHMLPFEWMVIDDIKKSNRLSEAQIREKEGEQILQKVKPTDQLILLDERGKMYSSMDLSVQLNRWMMQGNKRLIFLIGGAYGFSDTVYQRANGKMSLSKMTFSHQMVRLFVVEQLYRAVAIQRNLPYHHE